MYDFFAMFIIYMKNLLEKKKINANFFSIDLYKSVNILFKKYFIKKIDIIFKAMCQFLCILLCTLAMKNKNNQ